MAVPIGEVIRRNAHRNLALRARCGIVHGDAAVDNILIERLRLSQCAIQCALRGFRCLPSNRALACVPFRQELDRGPHPVPHRDTGVGQILPHKHARQVQHIPTYCSHR